MLGFPPVLRGLAAAVLALAALQAIHAGEPDPRTPGPQPDGSVILPNQWSLRPVTCPHEWNQSLSPG